MAETTTLTRTAPDISCDHCANAITGALSKLGGVARVAVSVEERRVDIDYDAAITNDRPDRRRPRGGRLSAAPIAPGPPRELDPGASPLAAIGGVRTPSASPAG